MNFTDLTFIIFFGLIWICAIFLRRWPSAREWFLIGCSLFVLASWKIYDCLIFLLITGLNFCIINYYNNKIFNKPKILLVPLVLFNILTLLFFKYRVFLGLNSQISETKLSTFFVGIPLAISFYTFHLISLIVDLYLKKIEKINLRQYLLYLSFFPHVIAGPIIRAKSFIPQTGQKYLIRKGLTRGFSFFITGFFLKIVIADNIGLAIEDLWGSPSELSGGDRWLLSFLFYCQIYGDFAGYSLMAIGMARLLGYRFPNNFRGPMVAQNLRDFWQRWHITLSQFLRDYLYIPLGGNRCSKAWSIFPVMTTMLIAGLWHGPSWNFVLWGGLHGMGIISQRIFQMPKFCFFKLETLCAVVITQLFITISWVFFRMSDITEALNFVKSMFLINGASGFVTKPFLYALLLFSVPIILHNMVPLGIKKIKRKYIPVILGTCTGIMLLVNLCVVGKNTNFIYFSF